MPAIIQPLNELPARSGGKQVQSWKYWFYSSVLLGANGDCDYADINKVKFFLYMVLEPFGSWPLFKFLNTIHSR
jgi:hypothetical protein